MKSDKLLLARDKDALLLLAKRQVQETEPSKAIDKAYMACSAKKWSAG